MARKDVIETEGKVVELLPHAMFLGELANGHRVEAYISGKMRLNFYSDLARRQSYVKDVPLRVDERPNNLPEKVRLSRQKTLPVGIETPVGDLSDEALVKSDRFPKGGSILRAAFFCPLMERLP